MTLATRLLTASGGGGAFTPPRPIDERLAAGASTGPIFTLGTGVNEFDLVCEGGVYYLAYDDKTQTVIRHAATVAGLEAAGNDATVAVRYPSLQLVGSTWHLWGWVAASLATKHYTAPAIDGPWTYSDTLAGDCADIHVRLNGSTWCAGYKNVDALYIGMLTATAPGGPWTDRGYTFATVGHPTYASDEEADPALFTFGNHAYISFSAWDGTHQKLAVVEVDPADDYQAIDSGIVIRAPTDAWEGEKIFNPIWLPSDGLMYYSRNNDGGAGGLGYIEPSV